MVTRFPALNALRALEAAGRHVSFTRAAEELNVTPGAISRQIRGLEDILGFPLFERNYREVKLTPECAIYVESLTDTFAQLERATRRLVDSRKQNYLHIHVAITFTLRWLVPRLIQFHALHPTREVRTSTVLPREDELIFMPTDVSIQIRNEQIVKAAAPALIAHRLVDIELVPVCSPQLLEKHGSGRDPSFWKAVKILQSSARPNDWGTWLTAANVTNIDPQGGIRFESSSLAYQAAIEGIGVAMGMRALVAEDLKSGRLVKAHPLVFPTETSFYLVYSQAAAKMAQVKEFRDWIVASSKTAA